MQRVVVLGPGGSGKSVLAAQIGEIAALPVIELDKIFWQEGLSPTPRDQWIATQQRLAEANRWVWTVTWGRMTLLKSVFAPQIRSSFWISQPFDALGEPFPDPTSLRTSGYGCSATAANHVRSL